MLASEFYEIFDHFPKVKERFSGCVSSDTIPKVLKLNHFIICNTDLSTGEGKHWFTCIRVSKTEVECFDSLGFSTSKVDFLKNNCQFKSVKTLKFNSTPFQSDTSTKCGKFVLYFLFERLYNQDIEFRTLLEEIFQPNLDENDIKVENFFIKIKTKND